MYELNQIAISPNPASNSTTSTWLSGNCSASHSGTAPEPMKRSRFCMGGGGWISCCCTQIKPQKERSIPSIPGAHQMKPQKERSIPRYSPRSPNEAPKGTKYTKSPRRLKQGQNKAKTKYTKVYLQIMFHPEIHQCLAKTVWKGTIILKGFAVKVDQSGPCHSLGHLFTENSRQNLVRCDGQMCQCYLAQRWHLVEENELCSSIDGHWISTVLYYSDSPKPI